MDYLILGSRLVIGAVFLAAALSKVGNRTNYAGFVRSVAELAGVSASAARRLAPAAVAVELATVLLLAIPATVAIGFAVGTVALTVFTLLLTRVLHSRRAVPCACFGARTVPVRIEHVVRNLVLLAGSVSALVALGTGHPGEVGLGGAAAMCLVAFVCVLTALRLDDLVALFRS